MSIQTLAKQLKIDKIPLVTHTYRNIQEYISANYNKEVVIDICTVCKSNCVYCLHQRKRLVKPELMQVAVYHDLISILKIEKVKKVHIFQSGEPFLNPDIYDMIFIGLSDGINVTVGTRLNAKIDFDKLEESICCNNSVLEFLITIDTIKKVHDISSGMDTRLMINNIRELAKYVNNPYVKFTFVSVVSKINEDDIFEVRDFVKSYGFNNWHAESMGYYMWKLAPQSELDMISKIITTNEQYKDRFDIVNGKFITKRTHCNAQIPTISPTGDVSICCHDMLHTINAGNVLLEGSLDTIIKSKKYQKLKKLGMNKQLEICKSCN
jgi:MoaA/NifB/PqqE/SkfB family radical SAM enzyme